MKKLFLTGTSGFLGWKIFEEAQSSFEIWGSFLSNSLSHPRLNSMRLDLTQAKELESALLKLKPDAIIHCAAQANANFCETHSSESHVINVDSSLNLANYCQRHSIPFVFVSSDLVFDGAKGNYRESDKAKPICIYGKQKLEAEDAILGMCSHSLVLRVPLMFGEPGPEKNNGLRALIQSLQKTKEVRLFTDEYRTAMYGRDVAKIILQLTGKQKGLFHVASRERLSRYELGKEINKLFGLRGNIKGVLQDSLAFPAPRPKDVSLSANKIMESGINIPPLKEQLKECFESWKALA